MGSCKVVHSVQMTCFHHRICSPYAFLPRLEQQFYGSVKLSPDRGQDSGCAESDSRMAVMAAGMHHSMISGCKPLPGRPVFLRCILLHRKGIYIKSEGCNRSLSAVQNPDNSGIALRHLTVQIIDISRHSVFISAIHFPFDRRLGFYSPVMLLQYIIPRHRQPASFPADCFSGQNLITEPGQLLRNNGGGSHFQPRRFRVFVEISPEFHQLFLNRIPNLSDLGIHVSLRLKRLFRCI